MSKTYRVEWSAYFDGVNIYDAVRQAQAALDDAVSRGIGATVFLVNEKYDDDHRVWVDLEDINNQDMIGSGWCDECGDPFAAANNMDHCVEEGLCWRHCTSPYQHGPTLS